MICVASLLVFSTIAYIFFKQILAVFQAPLHEKLFYTSPVGGFSFVIKLCITVGLIFTIPVIVNRLFAFVKPVIPKGIQRSFAWYSAVSVLLAIIGVVFAYFVSLPGALKFLTNFNKEQIQALITVDSYFTFVSTYLVGYALLFQTPIIMLFINRVKPIEPGSTGKYQRFVVGGSFVLAAVLTPTPDPWNQLLMALPMIILFQFGVVAVRMINRQEKATSLTLKEKRRLKDVQVAMPVISNSSGQTQLAKINNNFFKDINALPTVQINKKVASLNQGLISDFQSSNQTTLTATSTKPIQRSTNRSKVIKTRQPFVIDMVVGNMQIVK